MATSLTAHGAAPTIAEIVANNDGDPFAAGRPTGETINGAYVRLVRCVDYWIASGGLPILHVSMIGTLARALSVDLNRLTCQVRAAQIEAGR